MKQFRTTHTSRRTTAVAERDGSTLLIVVALLGMLAFLGFVFYTFAAQERANAVTFSQSAKTLKAPSLEQDALFDFALQQVILGPPDSLTQSILWGGRHSLLANMFGRDGIPWNGEGVNLVTSGGQPKVDMNFDGIADASDGFLKFIDSAVANGGTMWGPGNSLAALPTPDANYNSPDINSIFLSYDGTAVDASGANPTRVIIPSFFRPQYFNDRANASQIWFKDPSTANRVMRPHPEHVCVDASGNALTKTVNSTTTSIKRFVSSTDVSPHDYRTLGLRRPFTNNSFAPAESSSSANTDGSLGIWTKNTSADQFDIDLDVDTDGDGIMDAILMDLGYPPVRRGDGKLVVPLFAISIRDLNGLLNLNATGNTSGNLSVNLSASHQFGYSQNTDGSWQRDNLSKSNLALSTYEINPERALTTKPSDVATTNPEIRSQLNFLLQLFGYPTTGTGAGQAGRSVSELANLEWLMLNVGRIQFHLGSANSATTALQLRNAIIGEHSGRYGETIRALFDGNTIIRYSSTGVPRTTTPYTPVNGDFIPSSLSQFVTTGNPLDLPRAGVSVTWNTSNSPPTSINWPPVSTLNADDDIDVNEGETNTSTRWVHPLDFRGSGRHVSRYDFGVDLAPGKKGVDDDGNGFVDDIAEEGWIPSDDHGADQYPGIKLVDDDGNGVVDDLSEAGWPGSDDPVLKRGKNERLFVSSANRWPAYLGYHSYGTVRWGESASTGTSSSYLMSGTVNDSLLDDCNEMIIDPMLMSPNYSGYTALQNTTNNDAVFSPEEMLFLQGGNSDGALSANRSRLAELMPANLVANPSAGEIRKRLSTVSEDRREYGVGISTVGGIRSNAGSPWESNPQFPPSISGASNPYRDELFSLLGQRALLQTLPLTGTHPWQFKLNINRLLVATGGIFQFRQLSEQTSVGTVTAYNDRQALARDIYTLLYTLCQGQDTDYRQSGGTPTAAVAREMAQFAVNLVDALDTDNIITAFQYDEDLSSSTNGWNATTASPVVYGVERQLLAFKEAVGIRIKKVATNSDMTIFDDTNTPDAGRHYLFFELQNVSPLDVVLASSTVTSANATTTADWRIRLTDTTDDGPSYLETSDLNALYFLPGLNQASNLVQVDGNGNRVLPGGMRFSVSSQDGSDKFGTGEYRTSDFRADQGFDGTFERNIPSGGGLDTAGGKDVPTSSTLLARFPTPKCNLDLVWNYGDGSASPSRFVLKDGSSVGKFAQSLEGKTKFRLLLQRRAANGTANGTWVTVDRTSNAPISSTLPPTNDVAIGEITPPAAANGSTAALANINSYPRLNALQRNSVVVTSGSNNINNPSTDVTIAAWQLHNDRDFGSISELFQLPLCGPDQLTNGRLSNSEFYYDTTTDPASPKYYPTIAAARFLRPDSPDLTLNGETSLGNRWYRLLNFLEVPNRSHRHFGILSSTASTATPSLFGEPSHLPGFFGWPRTHGMVNLNMIRHPQVLSALIDDDLVVNDPRFINTATQNLDDATNEIARKWWVEFIKARDSRFVSGSSFLPDTLTGLYLPGTADARPFRSFDVIGKTATNADSPIENTILRSLPIDAGTNANESRRLFEVGSSTEHYGQPANEIGGIPLHPSARYRVLSKLMNNSTTRSNSFAVFITVQYYEAAEVSTDTANVSAIRIGGRLDDTPTHRGFFVVDRTGSIEQMKRLIANPVISNSYSFNPDTDRRSGTPNGIRWKDLVLYRQTLN